jgi:DNA-binding GntR family transcriptional regulator
MMKAKRGRQWGEEVKLPKLPVEYVHTIEGPHSSTQKTYLIVRHAILSGLLKPQVWLRQDDITDQLHVSRTPVREAFRLLSHEGLVQLVPNYGVMVSPLSMEEFEEIYAVRIGIEALAVRRAVRHLSLESFEKIERMYHDLYPILQSGNLEEYLHLEWLFRLEIYRIGSTERFLREIQSFRELAERYLRFAYTISDSLSDSYAMHKNILDAIEERNVGRAELLVQDALKWTLKTAGPVIAAHLRQKSQQTVV